MRTMSITIDEQLYATLKKVAGPRGMSRFIAEALRERLHSSQDQLYEEYLEAKDDWDREGILADWDGIATEAWR